MYYDYDTESFFALFQYSRHSPEYWNGLYTPELEDLNVRREQWVREFLLNPGVSLQDGQRSSHEQYKLVIRRFSDAFPAQFPLKYDSGSGIAMSIVHRQEEGLGYALPDMKIDVHVARDPSGQGVSVFLYKGEAFTIPLSPEGLSDFIIKLWFAPYKCEEHVLAEHYKEHLPDAIAKDFESIRLEMTYSGFFSHIVKCRFGSSHDFHFAYLINHEEDAEALRGGFLQMAEKELGDLSERLGNIPFYLEGPDSPNWIQRVHNDTLCLVQNWIDKNILDDCSQELLFDIEVMQKLSCNTPEEFLSVLRKMRICQDITRTQVLSVLDPDKEGWVDIEFRWDAFRLIFNAGEGPRSLQTEFPIDCPKEVYAALIPFRETLCSVAASITRSLDTDTYVALIPKESEV